MVATRLLRSSSNLHFLAEMLIKEKRKSSLMLSLGNGQELSDREYRTGLSMT